MAEEHKSPVDKALDVLFFAPLGLALTARDELPNLIGKGRQQVESQVSLARMIGQFAAVQGRKEAEKAASRLLEQAGRLTSPAQTQGAAVAARGAGEAVAADSENVTVPPAALAAIPANGSHGGPGTGNGSGSSRNGGAPGARAPGSAMPSSAAANGRAARVSGPGTAVVTADLAIPGYDTLSASQVVQRLAGLSRPELEAVRQYEAEHRGRRTILSKVAQLQTEPS